jgi:diguanylate cyclase (GGDEF)-like protein/PAS domain S-box-containing protein
MFVKTIEQNPTEILPLMFYVLEPFPPYSPIYISESFKIFGYPLEDWYKNIWNEVLHPDDKLAWERDFSELKELTSQYRIISSCGKTHYLSEKGFFLQDKSGNKLCWLSVIVDFTDFLEISQKSTEYQELFNNLNDIIYVSNLDGELIDINAAAEKILGYSRKEILSKLKIEDIIVSEYFNLIKERLKNNGEPSIYEIECFTKKGRKVFLEINTSVIKDKSGIAHKISGVARDITQRKKMIKALEESEKELKVILSALPQIVVVINKNGQFLKVLSTKGKFPYSKAKALEDVFSADEVNLLLSLISESLEKTTVKKAKVRSKDIWYEVYLSPINKKTLIMTLTDITEEQQDLIALKESEERYRELFENANDIIYVHDLQGNYISVNQTGVNITGYKKEEIKNLNFVDVVAPEYIELAREQLRKKLKSGKPSSYEIEIISKDGRRIHLELKTRLIYKDGKPFAVQGIGRDITERKKIEKALIESEEHYRQLAESISHQVWTALPNGKIEFTNNNLLNYFGCSFETIADFTRTKVHPKDKIRFLKKLLRSFRKNIPFETEARLLRKDGEYRWHLIRVVPGYNLEGKIVRWYGTNTDIHNQKEAEDSLRYLATHDALTRLINRTEFIKKLEEAIKITQDQSLTKFAVLFIDLDKFKLINDNFGHEIGDKFLQNVAEKLVSCARPYDVVARFGGDEFAILLNDIRDLAAATQTAERILNTLSEPIIINGSKMFSSVSIGIKPYDPTLRTPEEYLIDADIAMYEVKKKGRNGYEIFDYQMRTKASRYLQLGTELRSAIEKENLVLFYQPIVSLKDSQIIGFEALLRWNHPLLGLLLPNEFIDIAEETGLIVPIGHWVLRQAFYQLSSWHEKFPQYKHLLISINLSSNQLKDPALYSKIVELFEETNLPPSCLSLEVTEKAFLGNKDISTKLLLDLSSLGVAISKDNFGRGYSCLSYLNRFPFLQYLKLDPSFTQRIGNNKRDKSIVKALMMIGKSLGIKVIAEGIETEEQLQILKECGCKFGQGYLLSKPMPAEEITEILERGLIIKSSKLESHS